MVSRVESGQKRMRFDGVIAAANVLQVSTDYLAGLTDDPEPAARLVETLTADRTAVTELENPDAVEAAAEDDNPQRHLFARPGITPVPLVRNAGMAAGAAGHADDEHVLSYVPLRDDWLASHSLDATQCAVVEVIGRSMEPTLEHHAVFAVREPDGPVVKRLRHDRDRGRGTRR